MTRIDNPWLLLATLPLYHPVQDLKMTPLLQFTPVHFLKSTPLPLLTPVCNFEALLGASLISMNQQVLLRIDTPVFYFQKGWRPPIHKFHHVVQWNHYMKNFEPITAIPNTLTIRVTRVHIHAFVAFNGLASYHLKKLHFPAVPQPQLF